MDFWSINSEIDFFKKRLKNSPPERLFYKLSNGYFSYIPRSETNPGQTLQSRNSLIGQYTEKWCKKFLQPIASKLRLFAINDVTCPELGLTASTSADVAFCTTQNTNQSAENIKLIFEVKMSIVNNYSYDEKTNELKFEGDYKSHRGTPSILRSDSMLKAIGKSINIRVSGIESTNIPIIVLGNSPITNRYAEKVDFLKQSGVIQGFISLYPDPTSSCIKETSIKGFQTFYDYSLLQKFTSKLVLSDMSFFSSMRTKKEFGRLIALSAKESTADKRADKFLKLIRNI